MTIVLHLRPLSTSSQWLFTSCLSLPLHAHGSSPHASLSLSTTMALHLMPLSPSPFPWLITSCLSPPLHSYGSSPHASLSLSMTMALHLMPLSPLPCSWLFTSCPSLPPHDHGFSPQASLHLMAMPHASLVLSMTMVLHLMPLSTSNPWLFASIMPLSTSLPWLFTACFSLPLHAHGYSSQASLYLSMPMALHLVPLSTSPCD